MKASNQQTEKPKILVVEDDPAVAQTVLTLLEAEGYPVSEAPTSSDALALLSRESFPIVISDIYLDERTGLDILRRARALNPQCAVILMTAHGTLETVLEATQAGAFDYIAKPFTLDKFAQTVRNAEQAVSSPIATLVPDSEPSVGVMAGRSQAMIEIYKFISHVAQADSTVLLQGETGTGKELVARLIHTSGTRRDNRMVVVDCGALPASLIEAELFGAVRGAYTGADRDREGLIESAAGGTVFLDEIGDIDPAFQLRLLRFLQEREIRPVGSSASRTVDVRVIAATNRDLRQLVADKTFREDLWYRLHVTSLRLAPLRERAEDIPLLMEHFLAIFGEQTGRRITLSDSALKAATRYPWPGNIRQLQNVLERLTILHSGSVVQEPALIEAISALDPSDNRKEDNAQPDSASLAAREEDHIRKVLAATHGHKTRAAEILGIERKTLYRKLEKMRDVSS
jgi:DNA-binding NtrC family response regulator